MSRLPRLLDTGRPLVMGILNATPDSFSDGGRYVAPDRAVAHALDMIRDGVDIIDIGGESTRPGAPPVSTAEELDRVMPVMERLRSETDLPLSLDTSKTTVMAAALPLVDLVNDVTALRDDGAIPLLASVDTPVCLMHMQGEPRTMQAAPHYEDVVREVHDFFEQRIAACEAGGIDRHRLILDIGFGFGKLPVHNLTLVNRLETFLDLGAPLLVGLSRKSTIGKIVEDLLMGSVAGGLFALSRGARILRVHDVAETVAAVRVWQSMQTEKLGGSL